MHANRGQHWATLGATATGFFVLVAHALLETARDALFLSNIPASRLPWMYLVLALLWISISELGLRSRRRLDARRLLIASQVVAVAGTLVTAVLVAASVPFAYYALYVWAGVASMSVLVRHWQHLSGSFTATEAKRLFPLIGAGGVAGALVGYALAESFSRTIGVAASIPVAAVFFAASMIGPLLFFGPVTSDTGDDEMGSHDTLAERLRAVVENTADSSFKRSFRERPVSTFRQLRGLSAIDPPLSGPEVDGEQIRVGWTVTYTKPGLAPFVLRGNSDFRYRDGKIAYLGDRYDAAMAKDAADWSAANSFAIDPAYV